MSTISPPRALLGVQTPRVERAPADGVRDGHHELLRLCADVGLVLHEWQEYVLALWLRERRDGSQAAGACAENVPRQNGKGIPLEALGLDSLFVSKLPLTIWTAQEFDTAVEHYGRLSGMIKSDPLLHAKVANYYQSGQRTAIVLRNGHRIEFKARNKQRGRGFSAPRVILDEAMFLNDAMMGALFPTMAAQSMGGTDQQVVYAGSAALEESTVWRRVQARGTTGENAGRLAYAEWSVDPTAYDVHDRQGWAQANPSLGYRISEEFIAGELGEIGVAEFVRERLGVPDLDPSMLERDRPITEDVWARAEDRSSRPGDVVKFGIAVHPSRKWSALTSASLRPDGRVHVELIGAAAGVAWLAPRAVQVAKDWGAPVCLEPGSAALSLLPDLKAAGVEVVALTRRDVIAAFGRVSDLAINDKLRHTGQSQLTAAVHMAERRPSGEQLVWVQHGADITPLYAAALAIWLVALPDEAKSTLSF